MKEYTFNSADGYSKELKLFKRISKVSKQIIKYGKDVSKLDIKR